MDFATFLNYAFGIFGVFGALFGIYAYAKTREAKEPRCCYRTYRNITRLSPGDNPNIKLLYKTEEVDRVFTTYLWFWNEGKRPISKSDIPNNTDIELVLSDRSHNVRVLDCNIIKTSRDATNFNISRLNDKSIRMSFDFLDYKDGAVIEVQHSGGFDTKFNFRGIILGAPSGVRTIAIRPSEEDKKAEKAGQVTPKRFARKSTARHLRDIVIATGAVTLIILTLSSLEGNIDADPNTIVSIKRSEFEQVMTTEAPNVPATTVDNIYNKLTGGATRPSKITVPLYVVFGLFLATVAIIFFITQYTGFPFPSSLDFDLTQQNAKQTTKSKAIP